MTVIDEAVTESVELIYLPYLLISVYSTPFFACSLKGTGSCKEMVTPPPCQFSSVVFYFLLIATILTKVSHRLDWNQFKGSSLSQTWSNKSRGKGLMSICSAERWPHVLSDSSPLSDVFYLPTDYSKGDLVWHAWIYFTLFKRGKKCYSKQLRDRTLISWPYSKAGAWQWKGPWWEIVRFMFLCGNIHGRENGRLGNL